MKKFLWKCLCFIVLFSVTIFVAWSQQRQMKEAGLQDTLLLKDYKPQSIFKTPHTEVLKAKYPAIDMHMHAPRSGDLKTAAAELLKNMDACGIQKTILFCLSGHGHFDMAGYQMYFAGQLEDYEYPAEEVAKAVTGLPKVNA